MICKMGLVPSCITPSIFSYIMQLITRVCLRNASFSNVLLHDGESFAIEVFGVEMR